MEDELASVAAGNAVSELAATGAGRAGGAFTSASPFSRAHSRAWSGLAARQGGLAT